MGVVLSSFLLSGKPKGPICTKNTTALESVVFCYGCGFWLSVPFVCFFSWENKHIWAISVAFSYLRTELDCPHRIWLSIVISDPEALQSGFGVDLLIWPGQVYCRRILIANLDGEFFDIVFSRASGPPKHSCQTCWHSSPLSLSQTPKNIFTPIFCLGGRAIILVREGFLEMTFEREKWIKNGQVCLLQVPFQNPS